MKRLFFLIAALIPLSALAQGSFWNSKDAYLGQKRPTNTPLVFANKMLVPDSGIAMDRSAFSRDGKEYYYCNAQNWFDACKLETGLISKKCKLFSGRDRRNSPIGMKHIENKHVPRNYLKIHILRRLIISNLQNITIS